MMHILQTIRTDHNADVTTADETGTGMVINALVQATHFEGSSEEAQVALFLSQPGIKYSKTTEGEFVTPMDILRKSDILKTGGKKNGRGKRKKNEHKKAGSVARFKHLLTFFR